MLFHSKKSALGKTYEDGEIIIRQGEEADCMFVILEGKVEIIVDGESDDAFQLALLKEDEVFGELALFDDQPRIASARALGTVRVLSVDKKGFLQWIGEEPSFTLRILIKMAFRTRTLISEVVRLRKELRACQNKTES
ncbi:MAG: cyclic nucleotide-binding domain-containing protein [Magnetococcales bacterium]|nr:cyclic nucleotide-binding domain-containing protein [Magnetococcales bacterium]